MQDELSQSDFADFLSSIGIGNNNNNNNNGDEGGSSRTGGSPTEVEEPQNVDLDDEDGVGGEMDEDEEIDPWDLSAQAFSHSINDFAQNFYAKVL